MNAPIPVTILNGYLGAGKTTLLNRIDLVMDDDLKQLESTIRSINTVAPIHHVQMAGSAP